MTSGPAPVSDTDYDKPASLTIPLYESITGSAAFLAGEWRDEARCVELSRKKPRVYQPEHWFPEPVGAGRGSGQVGVRLKIPPHVKAACAECQVRMECLAYAIMTAQPGGIWGGHLAKTVKKYRLKILAHYRRREIK